MTTFTLHQGDSLEVLKAFSDNSIDSIVTDPPYGLSFMGKKWDYDVPSVEIWKECLRVLKPGGHLLSFSSARTYHRMVVNVEDAGFEIRDQLMWVYGSGFPKNHNISKAIDKRGGNPHLATEIAQAIKQARLDRNLTTTFCDKKFCDGSTNWTWFEGRKAGCRPPSTELFARICEEWTELKPLADKVAEVERLVVGQQQQGKLAVAPGQDNDRSQITLDITAATTDNSKKWEGWGTALKPAHEPIVLARKPISEANIAANVLKWGTGGLNIDKSRVGTETISTHHAPKGTFAGGEHDRGSDTSSYKEHEGRFPANFIHDGIEEDWSRFFYCAKTSKKERGKDNNHPTVKPIALMSYLINLVTPTGGTTLDPFMGSGSTGCAAVKEGYSFVGIDLNEEYIQIASKRLTHYEDQTIT
jgi:DNA modification methylase